MQTFTTLLSDDSVRLPAVMKTFATCNYVFERLLALKSGRKNNKKLEIRAAERIHGVYGEN